MEVDLTATLASRPTWRFIQRLLAMVTQSPLALERALRKASMEVFLTGSCWNDAVSMAAALKSLQLSAREEVATSVLEKGRQLTEGLDEPLSSMAETLKMTGPSSMLILGSKEIRNLFEIQNFVRFAPRKVFIFILTTIGLSEMPHDSKSIEQALCVADRALERMGHEDND